MGRRPDNPQLLDGESIEPQVSEPMANGTSPAATAAPDPLDDPPVQRSLSQGLRGGPVKEALGWLYPMPPASSIMATLAARGAPALSSLVTTVASRSNRCSLNGAAPQEVGMPPDVASRSFAPQGMPASGPGVAPGGKLRLHAPGGLHRTLGGERHKRVVRRVELIKTRRGTCSVSSTGDMLLSRISDDNSLIGVKVSSSAIVVAPVRLEGGEGFDVVCQPYVSHGR